MEKEAIRERTAAVLGAWNNQDVERVLACYTEDCIYRDPNTRGAVEEGAPGAASIPDAALSRLAHALVAA